ncbi:hypothetical protein DFS33DRAFT_1381278 [Desarmillaria ectypa]|nr:hypothetical protein DFS33DRAFT_1381278 [Desarmillaria ectypa]
MQRILGTTVRIVRPLRHRALYIPRPFSTSVRRLATPSSESPEDLAKFEKFQNTTVFKALRDNPDASGALNDFIAFIKKQGVYSALLGILDLQTPGLDYRTPPSKIAMIKLAMNPEFRAAFQKVNEECMRVGVDFSSKEVQQEIMDVFGKPPTGDD